MRIIFSIQSNSISSALKHPSVDILSTNDDSTDYNYHDLLDQFIDKESIIDLGSENEYSSEQLQDQDSVALDDNERQELYPFYSLSKPTENDEIDNLLDNIYESMPKEKFQEADKNISHKNKLTPEQLAYCNEIKDQVLAKTNDPKKALSAYRKAKYRQSKVDTLLTHDERQEPYPFYSLSKESRNEIWHHPSVLALTQEQISKKPLGQSSDLVAVKSDLKHTN